MNPAAEMSAPVVSKNSSLDEIRNSPVWDDRKIEMLRRVPMFGTWLDEGVDCLKYLAQAEEIHLQAGDVLVPEGGPAAFYLLLDGELRVLKKAGDTEVLLTTHRPGAFFGEIPLFLGTNFVAGGQAVGDAIALKVEENAFWAMLSACPGVTREIAKTMATRMQNLESMSQTREKLVSLGTLAAGLAHELNNPASAARRASSLLRDTMHEVEAAAMVLHGQGLVPEQCDLLVEGRAAATRYAQEQKVPLSAMQQADREDEITDWLDSHTIKNGYRWAPTFVTAGVSLEWLEEVAATTSCGTLEAVLTWLEASLRADGLIVEIEKSSGQIAQLVGAVKGYSHMDEAPQQVIDVHDGLEATLVMLKYKLRGIEIERDYDHSLPRFLAFGSELNQVWTNLLDNATDALKGPDGEIKKGAHLRLRTYGEGHCVVVEIADNGPGIPEAARARIFEPFFTTKGVGSGTGLGLDIAHRIVLGRHGGDIFFDTGDSGTTFTVRLPIEGAAQRALAS